MSQSLRILLIVCILDEAMEEMVVSYYGKEQTVHYHLLLYCNS